MIPRLATRGKLLLGTALLFLIGVYGLFFEFSSPGFGVAGACAEPGLASNRGRATSEIQAMDDRNRFMRKAPSCSGE